MVLKATRLDPAAASVEEIVLTRLANPAIMAPAVVPTQGQPRNPPHLSATTTSTSSSSTSTTTTSGDPTSVGTTGTTLSPALGPTSDSSSPTHIEQLTREIQAMATRVERVETQLQHSPTFRVESKAQQIEQLVRQTAHQVLQPQNHTITTTTFGPHDDAINTVFFTKIPTKTKPKATGGGGGVAAAGAPAGSRRRRQAGVRVNAQVGAQVNHSVRELSSTLRRLDRVFYDVLSHEKQRHLAATRINTLVRGFLTRVRYQTMWLALRNWRRRQSAKFLQLVHQFGERQQFLKQKIQEFDHDRNLRLLRQVVAELHDITLLHLPLRVHRQTECTRRFQAKQRMLLHTIWRAWKTMAFGKQSRKQMQAASKSRHATAKKRLEEMDRFEVITSEMVHEEVLKENIRMVRNAHTFHLMRMVFHLLVQMVWAPLQHKEALADAHWRRKLLVKTRNGWLMFHMIVQRERRLASRDTADDALDRRTLSHFEQPQNLKKIDNFHRVHCLTHHLNAWHRYVHRIRRVRRLFEGNLKGNLQRLFKKWRVQTKYQHELRQHAVNEWTLYCKRIYQTPFRAWYVATAQKRSARSARESICYAYQRRQRRQIKYAFFRLWKHQVLFGSVDGLHTKLHLLRALEDQKRFCLGLEENAKLYQASIAALETSVQAIEKKLMDKQQELKQVHDATQVTRFSLHQAEQTIVRTQGMLDAVRLVHPKTVDRIERVYQENPLFTTELQDVIQLQVSKRQRLLDRIAEDSKAMELESMVPGNGQGLHRDDQLLLFRVKWVLSRLDLGLGEQVSNQHEPSLKLHEPKRMHQIVAMNQQLCGLLEFLRTGDVTRLSQANNPLRSSGEAPPTREVTDPTRSETPPTQSNPSTSPAPPTPSTSSTQPTQPASATSILNLLSTDQNDDAIVSHLDMVDANPRWSSFLEALTIRFALDNQLSVKEKLVKHHAAMAHEIQELKNNPAMHNVYSAHLIRPDKTEHGNDTR